MKVFEPCDAAPLQRHRTLRIPCFFHSSTLTPYRLRRSESPLLDPLERIVPPSGEVELWEVAPETAVTAACRNLKDEVILIPWLPFDDDVYRRLETLLPLLRARGNAVLCHLSHPHPGPRPGGITLLVNLFCLFMGQVSREDLAEWRKALPPDTGLAWLYPLLPGLSDAATAADTLQWLFSTGYRDPVLPLVPHFDHRCASAILHRVDEGHGDPGRAYSLLFQTARSELNDRLVGDYAGALRDLEAPGVLPLLFEEEALKENRSISQRAFLLWHHLLAAGEDDLAWAWYRTGHRLWTLKTPLKAMSEEGNLDLLELDRRTLEGLRCQLRGESPLLHPIESGWL